MKCWNIIEQILRNPAVKTDRESTSLHCSSAGLSLDIDGRRVRQGGCRRQQFFQYHRYPKDEVGINVQGMTRMGFGNFAEGFIGDAFKMAGVFYGTQVPVTIVRTSPGGIQYRVNGYIDFLLKNEEGRPEIAELKTTGQFGEKGVIVGTAAAPLCPKVEHVLQVVPYIDWLTMPNQGVPVSHAKANILYLSREGKPAQHTVSLAPGTKHVIIQNDAGTIQWTHITPEKIYQDFDMLAEAIANSVIPPPDYELQWSRETVLWKYQHNEFSKTDSDTIKRKIDSGDQGKLIDGGDWQCGWCPFQKGCWYPSPNFKPRPFDEPGQLVANVAVPSGSVQAPTRVAVAGIPGD